MRWLAAVAHKVAQWPGDHADVLALVWVASCQSGALVGRIGVPVGPKAGCASRRLPKRCLCVEKGAGPSGDTPRRVASFHPLKRITERSQNQRCERKDHREDRILHTGHTPLRASGALSRSRRAQPSGPLAAVSRGDGHSDARRRDLRQRRHQESHTLAVQQTSLAVF